MDVDVPVDVDLDVDVDMDLKDELALLLIYYAVLYFNLINSSLRFNNN